MHDADVCEHGLREHAGDIAVSQIGLEGSNVVEFYDARCQTRVDRWPDIASTILRNAARQRHKRLIDRTMIAIVEDKYLWAPCNLASNADRETVRIRCRQGELPVAQSKAALQLFANPKSVLAWEHSCNAALQLLGNRGDGCLWGVAGHCAG